MTMTPDNKRTAAWIAAGVVVLALIAVFAMPNHTTTGDSLTNGTPPAATDTTPAPVPPAAPY